jgi:hypothetical protein
MNFEMYGVPGAKAVYMSSSQSLQSLCYAIPL